MSRPTREDSIYQVSIHRNYIQVLWLGFVKFTVRDEWP